MIQYNVEALMKCKEFDAMKAVGNFPDQQAYFYKLTEFSETWHNYLYLYNPTVVIYGEDVRKNFVSDMDEVRKITIPLEMTLVNSKLNNLNDVLKSNDAKGLADGLKVFYATLKIAANGIAAARIADSGANFVAEAANEPPLIITVDDKPELLTAIRSVLCQQYKVIAVTSGAAALKAIETYTPALFLLDIEMPVMDGYELAKNIRMNGRFEKTPIIFFTSKASREHVINAMAHGGNDYLLKPVDSNILLGKIQHHINEARK